MGDIGDDYHVLKYHSIQYYHDNTFWLYTFRANFYKGKHLNELCVYLSIK